MERLFLFFVLSVICLSSWTQIYKNDEQPFVSVERMPSFPGGESEMYKFIGDRLFYPWGSDSIKGRVIVRFVVDKTGDVKNAKVLRGINPLADSIAVSIIRQMPKWDPGTQNGMPVPVYYTLPVIFRPEDIDIDKKLSKSSLMPRFGGGVDAMCKFISENLKYPLSVSEMETQGRVIIQFIVDSKGKIWHPYVLRSLHPAFDAEALRVISLMPDWEVPENSVGCYLYTLPVIIKL